jgi:hypothetical protein
MTPPTSSHTGTGVAPQPRVEDVAEGQDLPVVVRHASRVQLFLSTGRFSCRAKPSSGFPPELNGSPTGERFTYR